MYRAGLIRAKPVIAGCSFRAIDQQAVKRSRAILHGLVRMKVLKRDSFVHNPVQKSLIGSPDHKVLTPACQNVFKVERIIPLKILDYFYLLQAIVAFKCVCFDNAATLSWFVSEA